MVGAGLQRLIFRRARSSFDGPFPVFALMGNQRVPLSLEQIEWLNQEALSLANGSGPEIEAKLLEILAADHRGNEAPLHVAGFMRMPSPYDGGRKKANIDPPRHCDQCARGLSETGFFFDACTTEDLKWSWMCPPCFFGLGCGVGEGWGQLYRREKAQFFLILG